MRALMMVLAMILITAPAVFAQGTACPTTTTQVVDPCAVVDLCMMRCFQVNQQQLTALRNQGWTDGDIAMAAAISQKANVSITQVAADYRANPNWQAVASKYNLTLSDLMTLPNVATTEDEDAFNRMFISSYYNIPLSDIDTLRRQGYSWSAINMMANAACQTRQPIMTIANLRGQGMSWSDIATRYNVPVASLTTPMRRTVAVVPTTATVAGAGPIIGLQPFIMRSNGGILLTQEDAMRYFAMGYDWTEVAVAANLARETGVPIEQILPRFRTGTTPIQLTENWGINPCVAFDFTTFPFERRSIYSTRQQETIMAKYQCFLRNCGASEAVIQQCCPAPTTAPVCPPAPVCP